MCSSNAAVPGALAALDDQPRVRSFLSAAVAEKKLSHAYLFVGAPGAGMQEAALALAQCLVCPNGGDGSCDECIRVRHHAHPDVHFIEPASATGYLVSQVRAIITDASLAPVRASRKVYVILNAGLLRGAAANALLKTIEEPPEGVFFVLIARSAEVVMPTIVSRCQQVPFRVVSPAAARREVMRRSGANATEADIALSIAQTPEAAANFLASSERRQVRRVAVRIMSELARDDSWDVLKAAGELLDAMREQLGAVRTEQKATSEKSADYLSAKALKQLEDAQKRELTARERSGIMEGLFCVQSLLRDMLMRCEDPLSQPVNGDVAGVVDQIASTATTAGVLGALDAVRAASDALAHNVSPQLVVETMLLRIKEALECPPLSR